RARCGGALRELVAPTRAPLRAALPQRRPAAVYDMEAVAATARHAAVVEAAAAPGRHIEARFGGRSDRAALDGGVGALGDDHSRLGAVHAAAGQGAAASVVTEPGAGRGIADTAVVELRGGAVTDRHRRVPHLREI